MYMYMYLYMCIYIYMHIHIYIYVHMIIYIFKPLRLNSQMISCFIFACFLSHEYPTPDRAVKRDLQVAHSQKWHYEACLSPAPFMEAVSKCVRHLC